MIIHQSRPKPEPWSSVRTRAKGWVIPFLATEHACDWAVYWLSHWSFLETLEYLSSLSILIAVIFYFAESGNRVKQRHYQAWQVINTAQGKGGSGGRIDALQELNHDKVTLTGVDLSEAFLQGVRLDKARLMRANFHNADVRDGSLINANLEDSVLEGANFRGVDFRKADLRRADLTDADLSGANLENADLTGANLSSTDLHEANLRGVRWGEISNIKMANLAGVKNPPQGFVAWALQNGAVQSN